MKNFTNNFKQFTSRLSARWLIMALMLLVGTSSAWGWTIYYDNSGTTSWSDVYIVIGHDTWWRSYKMTKNNNLFQYTDTGWDDATFIAFSNSHKNSSGGNNTDWNSISNIRFGYGVSHVDKHVFTTNSSKLVDITHVSDVLNGNVIGFYVGEYTSWNQQQFYVKNSSITIPTCLSFESGSQRYGVVYASSLDYNISHGDGIWNGPTLGEKAVLGTAYLVTSDNTVSKNAGTLPSCTFSIDNTIKAGETTTVLSNSTSGKSYFANNANKKYVVDSYYVKKSGETSLTKLEVEGSELQTQSLAVGEYTIYVLLFDGRIYAKGGEQTLTVETACEKPNAPDFGTNGVEVCEGTQVTLPTIAGVTLKWYDNNDQEITDKTFNATENKTYYAVVVGDCESDKTPYAITIKTKPTVTLNPTENTVCSGVALDGITRYVEIKSTEGSQISWYAAAQGGDALAPSIALDVTSYFAEATLNGCSSDRAEFTITDVLSAPTEVPNVTAPETICDGESAVLKLNNKGANYTYKVNEVEVDFTNNEYTVYPTITTDYKVSVENKCGSLSTTKTITVNPLPIISISGSEEAVLYEDVTLTATGTNINEVNWTITNGTGELSNTTGTSVKLTSSTAGTVKVKATATSEKGCTKESNELSVVFGAENCTPVPSNDIKITFTHPAKNNNNASCQYWGFGYIFKDGVTPNNDRTNYLAVFPNKDQTIGSKTVTLSNVQTAEIKVYLNAYYEYSSCRASTQVFTLQRGGSYSITISSDQQGNGNWEKVPSVTKTGSLTQDPPITAPAVKMISAEYDEVNDKIVAKGAVYKTGCGVTFWGFQYSKDGQTWGTADADFIRPSTNNSLTDPGEFDYSFTIPNAGGGDIYYIRAYALNNYNGSYALSNAVYSATSLPIEIPSSIIESATISLVDSEGEDSDVTEVCPQSTVYLKVSYVGGDFKDYEAADDFPGTNLELVNHDKAKNEAIFSYTATATGVANITISNDNTSITTTDGVSITLKNVAPVNAPMISISQATICDDRSATITVKEPIAGLTYTLYKETTKIAGPVIYDDDDDDLTFNVTEAGSYTVRAEESVCKNYANSMAVELKVVTSDVKIGLAVDKTTVNPWQPLKLTVTAPEGYAYTIDALNDVVYTQAGNVYTIKIPRPNDWSPGNSGDSVKTKDITFEAKIQVTVDLTCGSSSIKVKLEDTDENCK